jgi:alpha-amylase
MKNASGEPRWLKAWRDPKMAKMIAFHNRFHGEEMEVLEGNDDMLLFRRGQEGFVVINKSSRKQSVSIPSNASLTDVLTGKRYSSSRGRVDFTIDAKTSLMMW